MVDIVDDGRGPDDDAGELDERPVTGAVLPADAGKDTLEEALDDPLTDEERAGAELVRLATADEP
jgi:hypothetical protein